MKMICGFATCSSARREILIYIGQIECCRMAFFIGKLTASAIIVAAGDTREVGVGDEEIGEIANELSLTLICNLAVEIEYTQSNDQARLTFKVNLEPHKETD